MKTIEVSQATNSLGKYAREIEQEPTIHGIGPIGLSGPIGRIRSGAFHASPRAEQTTSPPATSH
jgi:hypothetical protein